MKYDCNSNEILKIDQLAQKHITGSAVYSYGSKTRIDTHQKLPQETLTLFREQGYDFQLVTD